MFSTRTATGSSASHPEARRQALQARALELPGLGLPGNLFLAPVAGYSDAAFRAVCLEHGAHLCFTEMVSAEALCRGNRKTLRLIERAPEEPHLAVQLFAAEPRAAARAVSLIRPAGPALIDLNCGCSVPKILKAGCGAALLRHPGRIRDILRAMREQTDRPLSVKLRSGWDSTETSFLEAGQAAVGGGAALVSLHPRTRSQGFTGRADLGHLRLLKEALSVPVIGSGDLFSPEDACRMLGQTGCDGVMFARGALGNPFIFEQTAALLAGRPLRPVPPERRLQVALRHLGLAVRLRGEGAACREFRKHFAAYTRGVPGAAQLRRRAVRAESLADYRAVAEEFLASRRWG